MPRATTLPRASSASAVTETSSMSCADSLKTVPATWACSGLVRSTSKVTRKFLSLDETDGDHDERGRHHDQPN